MKKILALVLGFSSFYIAGAQDTLVIENVMDTVPNMIDTLPIQDPNDLIEETEDENRQKRKLNISQLAMATRSKDHLLLQLGFDGWSGTPDSINTSGLARSFNVYFMFDFPFKTNPRFSAAIGAGIATSNMYFKDTYLDITGRSANRANFQNVGDTNHFKKFKLLTSYLEAPVELRFVAKPENPKKSFKAAVGAKVGLLLAASTKGKTLLNSAGRTVNAYTSKEKSKSFFNSPRISVTGRLGYGNLSLFGSYQVNTFFKEGFGPDVKPFSIGITLSGL